MTGTIHDGAPLMLSVSGARGIVGRSMTPTVAATMAKAFGDALVARHGHAPLVCLGRDGRPSGPDLAIGAAAGLVATGCRVVDLGIVPTPTVGLMVTALGASGGMVITASHNPTEWNGLKLINGDGVAPPAEEAKAIIDAFRAATPASVPPDSGPAENDTTGIARHVERLLGVVDGSRVKDLAPRVVVDSVNGAGGPAARLLLDALGCDVVHLNAEPTGQFAHPPEPLRENLLDLAKATADDEGAVAGFAQDPDADRLAIVDENGRYIGEEMTLALAAQRWLELGGGGPIVTNLSTSRMVDDIAASHGTQVVRTPVGEAHVVTAMRANDATLGGEGNGGVVLGPVVHVRDSLSSMALVLDTIAATGSPLSTIVAAMPHYEMVKRKFDIAPVGGAAAVPAMVDRLAGHYADDGPNTSDGIRVDLADSWVHFRASNTEPIVRLIAEAPTAEAAEALVDGVAGLVGIGG